MNLIDTLLSPALVAVPFLGAALVLAWPGRDRSALFRIAIAFACLEAALSIRAFTAFDRTLPYAQFTFVREWFTLPAGAISIPVRLHFGIDGVSVLLIALTGLLGPVALLSARGHVHDREREFLAWTLVLFAGIQGVFLARDLLLFYVFWEVSLIPLYFVIGIWGGPRRVYATVKFFLYTLLGSLVLLVALLYLAYTTGTVDLQVLAGRNLPLATQTWCFLAFALAFAVKVPMLPFHTWLPDAHVEAPTAGSIVLAGVLLKLGTYGFLQIGLGLFPAAAVRFAPWLAGLGAVAVVYGSLLAYGQRDLKKLVAYSSVAHMGTIAVGLFALNGAGLRGSLLQMVNHGLSSALLFFLVGVLYERRHVREIEEFGGLARVTPLFAIALTIATLSSIGLPGLNGFPGEFLCLKGAFDADPWLGAAAALGTILGAVYMLSMVRRVLYGPLTRRENQNLTDLDGREVLAVALLCVPIVWIGVKPSLFVAPAEATLDHIAARVERGRALLAAAPADGNAVAALVSAPCAPEIAR